MLMSQDITAQIDECTLAFLGCLASFDQKALNLVPFEGSWTAAQVAEHVHKSDNMMLDALQAPGTATDRASDANVARLEKIFLDFESKLSAPDIIRPSDSPHHKQSLLTALEKTRTQIRNIALSSDLSLLAGPTPAGDMTRLELLHFVVFHTQRHLHQLGNIARKLDVKS